MKRHSLPLFNALTAAICILFFGSTTVFQAEENTALLESIETSLTQLEAGKYKRAARTAENALEKFPDDYYLQKIWAISMTKAGEFDDAKPMLVSLQERNPLDEGVQSTLQEVERQSTIVQEYSEAEQFRNQVPRSEYGRLTNEFDTGAALSAAEAEKPRRWDLAVSAIPQYDSNVLNENDSVSSPLNISSGAITVTADGEYRFIDQRIDDSYLTWGIRTNAYHNHYFRDEAQDFNYTFLAGSTFIRRHTTFLDNNLEWEIDFGHHYSWLGGNGYSDGKDTGFYVGYDLGNFATLGIHYHYYRKNFFNDPDFGEFFGRDAKHHIAGVNLSRYFGDRVFGLVGYNYHDHNADGTQYTYYGHEYVGMLGLAVSDRLTLTGRISHRDSTYPDYLSTFGPRRDDYTVLSLGAAYKLTENLSLNGSYSRIISSSNDDLWDFNKDLFGLGLSYQF